MKKIFRSIVIIGLVFSILGGLSLGFVMKQMKPLDAGDTKKVAYTVQPGATSTSVAADLEKLGFISSAKIFEYVCKYEKAYLQAGPHGISKSMTMREIIKELEKPKEKITYQKMTLAEGLTVEKMAPIVASATGKTEQEVLAYWDNPSTIQHFKSKYWFVTDAMLAEGIRHPFEGYFYPETYYVYENKKSLELVTDMLLAQTQKELEPYKAEIQANQTYNVHQLITLASIVERETLTADQKKPVAGVFMNRLEADMPLQSDITVLYALGIHKEQVLYKDLEVDSPYNTYKNTGIPIGPISTITKESIDAVVHPEENDYLYFFASQEGVIYYAKTYEEHLANTEAHPWDYNQ